MVLGHELLIYTFEFNIKTFSLIVNLKANKAGFSGCDVYLFPFAQAIHKLRENAHFCELHTLAIIFLI